MSKTRGEIAKALASFQADMPTIPKKQTAKVPTKDGGSYSYTYANLADVCEAAMPLLVKHGLSFSACPRSGDHGYEVIGILLHESGEYLEGALPLHGNQAQQLGSSLTYARRYLLGAMTGIVTDDDDDGALAQQTTQRTVKPMTARTRGELFALFNQKGIPEEQQLTGVNLQLGTDYTSRGQISEEHAREVIKALRARPDAAPIAPPTDTTDPSTASADPNAEDDPWKKDQ